MLKIEYMIYDIQKIVHLFILFSPLISSHVVIYWLVHSLEPLGEGPGPTYIHFIFTSSDILNIYTKYCMTLNYPTISGKGRTPYIYTLIYPI